MRRQSRGLSLPHLPGRVSARRRRELALVFALIFGAGTAPLQAERVPFETASPIINNANGALSVASADIDGDGDLDAFSAWRFGDRVAWHENLDGSGKSWTTATIASIDSAYSVVPADVDGDGDVDAVSAALDDDELLWHENVTGDGSSWTTHTIASVDGDASVFAADVDGDGRPRRGLCQSPGRRGGLVQQHQRRRLVVVERIHRFWTRRRDLGVRRGPRRRRRPGCARRGVRRGRHRLVREPAR